MLPESKAIAVPDMNVPAQHTRQIRHIQYVRCTWSVDDAAAAAHTCAMLSGERRIVADDDVKAELERLRAENERLKNRQTRGVSLKVSEKGGVSVYGLGRFPVTLYKEQWTRLLDMSDDIRSFIKENEARLKAKE
jgi:hypothetical protein